MKRIRSRERESKTCSDSDCLNVEVTFCETREKKRRKLDNFRYHCETFYKDWMTEGAWGCNENLLNEEIRKWILQKLVPWCERRREKMKGGYAIPPLQISYTRSVEDGYLHEKWDVPELKRIGMGLERGRGELNWRVSANLIDAAPDYDDIRGISKKLSHCPLAHIQERYSALKRRGLITGHGDDAIDLIAKQEQHFSTLSFDGSIKTANTTVVETTTTTTKEEEEERKMEVSSIVQHACLQCNSEVFEADTEEALFEDAKLTLIYTNLPWIAKDREFEKYSKYSRLGFYKVKNDWEK